MDGNIQPGLDGLSSRNKESELGKAAQAGGGFAGTGGVGGRYSEAGQDQMEMLLAPAVKTPHTRQQCVSDERLQSWCHPEGRPPQCRVPGGTPSVPGRKNEGSPVVGAGVLMAILSYRKS